MALLEILEFPDPRLRKKAKPVVTVDESVKILVADMFETMYHAKGIGLAATQINVTKRVVVMDLTEEANQRQVFINPKFKPLGDEQIENKEGCLSVPGFYELVTRYNQVEVTHLDIEGKPQSFQCDGLMAVCIQHEIDHLDGKLFVDYISSLKRDRIKHKLLKERRGARKGLVN